MMGEVVDLITQALLEPKRNEQFCLHNSVYVIEKTRVLQCKDCDSVVEPFDYLWKIANKQSNSLLSNKALSNQKKQLTEEVEYLKRQRTNLRAQLRNLKVKG